MVSVTKKTKVLIIGAGIGGIATQPVWRDVVIQVTVVREMWKGPGGRCG